MRTIIIEPYNDKWPNEFAKIREYLWPYIKDSALDIIHIGSTSIPGLAAKPIIDLNIIIDSYEVFPLIVGQLRSIGYEHTGDGGIPTRECFLGGLREPFIDHHMYVCQKDSQVLDAQILFRNYLRQSDSIRDEYATLKKSLAEKYRHNIESYVDGKHKFIMGIVMKALKQRDSSC